MSEHTFPPAVEPIANGVRVIPIAALHIVGRAIDAGLFYEQDVKAFCRGPWMQAFPVTPTCITLGPDGREFVDAVDGDFAARKAQFEALKDQLRDQPRGAWAMVRRPWGDDPTRFSWSVALSTGDGNVQCPDLSGMAGQPTPEAFIDREIGYEVYLSRNAEQARRARLTSLALIRERAWMPGTVLRDITLGSKRYSTAKIVKIEGAMVSLYMTRRGSRARWEWSGLAQSVEHAAYPPIAGRIKLIVSAAEDAAAA